MDLLTLTSCIDITELLRHCDVDMLTDLYLTCSYFRVILNEKGIIDYMCTLYSLSPVTTFSQLVLTCDTSLLTRRSYLHLGVNTALERAAAKGDLTLVYHMLEKGAIAINNAMVAAASSGHEHIVDLMLEKGATDYNRTKYSAIEGCHINIVKKMVEKSHLTYRPPTITHGNGGVIDSMLGEGYIDHDTALRLACKYGELDTVKLLVDRGVIIEKLYLDIPANKGYTDVLLYLLEKNPKRYMEDAACSVCIGGHLQLMRTLISLDEGRINYNACAQISLEHNYINIFRLMLEKGANDYSSFTMSAAAADNLDILIEMVGKVDRGDYGDIYDVCLRCGCLYGHINIVDYALGCGAKDYEGGMRAAADGGHLPLVEKMISLGATDYNHAFGNAVDNGHLSVVKFLLDKGKYNYERCCGIAVGYHYIDIVDLLLSRGYIDKELLMKSNDPDVILLRNR